VTRSILVLALAAVGCGEEDDFSPPPPNQTTGGSQSGGGGGTSDGSASGGTGAGTSGGSTGSSGTGSGSGSSGPGSSGTTGGGGAPYGDCPSLSCPGDEVCVQSVQQPGALVCATPCLSDLDCPAPPDGDAVPTCAPPEQGSDLICRLDCSGGQVCPTEATCLGAWCWYI
jgi:hypothetical protein